MTPRAALLLAMLSLGCSTSEDQRLSLDAKAGEPCKQCSTCTSVGSGCVCKTCTDYAQDVEGKVLLACTSSGWSVYKKCPGGVSVTCTSSGTYQNKCLDDKGNEVP